MIQTFVEAAIDSFIFLLVIIAMAASFVIPFTVVVLFCVYMGLSQTVTTIAGVFGGLWGTFTAAGILLHHP